MNENLYIAHKNLPHKTLRVHSGRPVNKPAPVAVLWK